LVELHIVRS